MPGISPIGPFGTIRLDKVIFYNDLRMIIFVVEISRASLRSGVPEKTNAMWWRSIVLLFAAVAFCVSAAAQKVALKNNLLMDGMASPNLGLEFRTGASTSVDIPASLNLWSFGEGKKFKHVAVQPEFRWWSCQPFAGHFWGLHAHYASYNVGGIGPFSTIEDNRYDGWLAGAGISYGYNWILAPRWSIEASVGVGYAYFSYDKYPCGRCRPRIHSGTKHYFGPTKIAVTLVFLIK